MPDYSLGTAHGTVVIDSDTTGLDKANRGLDTVRSNSDKSRTSINDLGRNAGIAGTVIAGGLALAVKTTMDFDAALSGIQATSGATGDQLEAIRKKALQLGADTTFSASEAADAMAELSKAGLSVDEILGGAADATVALAAATGVDLATAATIASDAMNTFGLAASDLPGVADTLAQVANASSIDVTDLGMALSQVGAVAKLAGLSLEDTTSAIGQLGNAGIKGSDAGTSLKTLLQNLQPTTKAATAALTDLGIITADGSNKFYDAQGNLKSLRDIQEILHDSTEGLTAAQKQQVLQTIFGSDAIRAAAVLADGGAQSFDDFAATMKNTGTAAEQAAIRQNNLKGSVEQLKGATETLAIGIGTALTPAVRWLADGLAKVANFFNSLPAGVQSTIAAVLAGAAGFLLFAAGAIKVANVIRTVSLGFKAFNAVLSANPIIRIIAIIALLVTALITAYQSSETFRNIVNAVFSAIGDVVSWLWDNILQPFFSWVEKTWPVVWNFLKDAWENVGKPIFDAISNVVTWLWTNILQPIFSIIGSAFQILWTLLSALWENIGHPVFNFIATIVTWLWTNILQPIISAIGPLFEGAFTVIKWLWDNILYPVFTAIGVGLQALAAAFSWVADHIGQAWDYIKSAFTAAWDWIKSVFNAIGNGIQTAWNWITGIFQSAGNSIGNAMTSVWNWIRNGWNNIINFFRQIPGWVIGVFQSAINWLLNAGRSILQGLWNGIQNVWNAAIAWIRGIPGSIWNVFSSAGSWLLGAGRALIEGLWNGIQSAASWLWGKIQSWAQSVLDGVLASFGISSPSKVFRDEVGWWLAAGLAEGINDGAPMAQDAAVSAAQSVLEAMQSTLDDGAALNATIGANLTPGSLAALGGQGGTLGGSTGTAGAGLQPVVAGTDAAALAAQGNSQAAQKIVNIDLKTYNPVAEKASDSEARKIRAAAAVGSF